MKTKYESLNTMLEDMQDQNPFYQPTAFWQYGSSLIIDELEKHDIKNFRSLQHTRSFFVPGYTAVDYLQNPKKYNNIIDEFDKLVKDKRFITRLQRVFNGYSSVFNDYRVLTASNIDSPPFTDKVSESKIGNPIEQHTINNRNFSRSFMNYLLGLNYLKKNVDTSKIKTVMEIGGGFGTLGEILLKDTRNEIFYINADIPPVGFISSYYLQEIFGEEAIATYDKLKHLDVLEIEQLKEQYKALNLCSWQIPQLQGTIDLFVNFISFQEMEPHVVKNYCYYIDNLKPKFILLRNILEGKRARSEEFKDGVLEPILGTDYDTYLPNYRLVNSDSATFGFITEDNFHSQLRIYERNI